MPKAELPTEDNAILPSSRLAQLIKLKFCQIRGKTVTYTHVGHSDDLTDPEEQVRADLYLDLVTEYGYTDEKAIEMEKFHKIGHPYKKSDAKIDIVIKDKKGNPFLLVELKSPSDYEIYMEDSIKTQLFNLAAVENQSSNSIKYLVYHTRQWNKGKLQEKTITIDYSKYKSFDEWDLAGRPNLRSIPREYGLVRAPKYVKGGAVDLRIDVNRDELQRIRKDLHNILWGGGKYQNELFFNLVGLFLVKIYDEKETIQGQPYQFQVFFEGKGLESAKTVYARMNDLYFKSLKEYLGYSKDEIKKIKDIIFDDNKVRYVVEVLQGISFTQSKFDVIGEFFEGIVRGEFKQTKGQYLTHTNLIRFMIAALQLDDMALQLTNAEKRLPFVIDPSCGSGAFLIESMNVITGSLLKNEDRIRKSSAVLEFIQSSFPEHRRNAWAKDYIYGIEINGDLAAATKVNMVGHGDGSANIEAKDALMSFDQFSLGRLQIIKSSKVYPKPVNEQFDVVLSNPPFSVTVDRDTASLFPANYIQGEAIAKAIKGSDKQEIATELLFIERWYQLLSEKGRMAVVLPESVFDTSSARDVRIFLFKYFKVHAIISITNEAFSPYTTTKTNILFAEKKSESEVKDWNTLWEKYSVEFDKISQNIQVFVKEPALVDAVQSVVKAFSKKIKRVVQPEEIEEIGRSALDVVRNAKTEKLALTELRLYLINVFEDLATEEKETLVKFVDRKKTLIPKAKEYLQRKTSVGKLRDNLIQLLGDQFNPTHEYSDVDQMILDFKQEMDGADKDWWVFNKVCQSSQTYNLVLAHADEVGYKRGIRGEDNRPNELYTFNDGQVTINTDRPEKILDVMRANIRWSSF